MLLRNLIASATLLSIVTAGAASAQAPAMPDGRGKEPIMKTCGSCHELARVTAQRRSKAQWHETVDDMIARGAQVSDADYDDVIAYLGTNFSTVAASGTARP